MSLINYFFIGFIFTFLVDTLIGLKSIKNHPKMKDYIWGWNERIIGILFWPVCLCVFLYNFLKEFFK